MESEAEPIPAQPERSSVVKMSKVREMTGDHMVMSKGVSPHAFSVVEVDYANVDDTRSARKSQCWTGACPRSRDGGSYGRRPCRGLTRKKSRRHRIAVAVFRLKCRPRRGHREP